jgi:hypothetical protein
LGQRIDEGLLVTKKYDDASWHYDGDFPSDLPIEAGATHIGMFFAWAVLVDLAADAGGWFDLDEIRKIFVSRSATPGATFLREFDGKLVDDMFLAEGAEFTTAYYQNGNGYFTDYGKTLGKDLPTLYHIADEWSVFDRFKPVLDRRLDEWKRGLLVLK